MKKFEVIWSDSAKIALKEIVDYIKMDNKSAAKKFRDLSTQESNTTSIFSRKRTDGS